MLKQVRASSSQRSHTCNKGPKLLFYLLFLTGRQVVPFVRMVVVVVVVAVLVVAVLLAVVALDIVVAFS